MSTTTTNYGLIKPDTTDPILIGQLNDNSDAIDAALKENADAIENKPDAADIPTPSTAAPAMDGTAAAGTSTDYARADHVHPSDTSKQDALTTAQLAAANSGINSAKVEQIESNKNNISTVQTQTNWNSNNGVKNILDYVGFGTNDSAGLSTFTTKGVTYKKNADGTISAYTTNTGASGNAYCYICDDSGIIQIKQYFDGKHILSCDTYSTNHYALFYKIDSETSVAVKGDTLLPNRNDISTANIILQVYSGEIISESTPIVFNPMIRLSSISDPTYQPYAMSNAELTAAIQALQAQLANQ